MYVNFDDPCNEWGTNVDDDDLPQRNCFKVSDRSHHSLEDVSTRDVFENLDMQSKLLLFSPVSKVRYIDKVPDYLILVKGLGQTKSSLLVLGKGHDTDIMRKRRQGRSGGLLLHNLDASRDFIGPDCGRLQVGGFCFSCKTTADWRNGRQGFRHDCGFVGKLLLVFKWDLPLRLVIGTVVE